ncbi:hypothetical protein Efla_005852 [Eimeria flavescens]
MASHEGGGASLDTGDGNDASVVCLEVETFVCPDSVYYCEVLQRNAAWIIFSKGVNYAEQEALELGAAWMGALLEQVGRQARLFATLRGTAAVNYCDIKQAVRVVCPSAYALLFAASVDPVAGRSPKRLPPKAEGSRILTADECWLVAKLNEHHVKQQASSPSQPDVQQKSQQESRPAHVPEYLPKYPPSHLYRRTETPWSLEIDPHVAEFKRKYRKLELQLQLPQLQLPEAILENAQGGSEGGGNGEKGFWGVPAMYELQEQQKGMRGQRQEHQTDVRASPSRKPRKAEPGTGDRPPVDLYLG